MTEGTRIGGWLIIFLGVLVIFARTQRWNWFNNHYKIRNIEDILGTKGADLLYWFIGLVNIVLGLLLMLGVIG
jgi:hypothetical protein